MIRLLMVAIVIVPWTIYLTLEILWHVYRKSPDRQRIFESAPRRWSRLLLKAAGVRVVAENPPAMPLERPLVVVANHVSWFDVLALCAVTPGRYLFVAKKEVRRAPFLGRSIEECGHIFIDRSDRKAALDSLIGLRERLANEKPIVIMFPEGTRSATGELQPFKKGAFVLAIQAGADVVPTAVVGSRAVMRKHSLLIHSGTITVRYGAPIAVAGRSMEGRDQLIQDSWEAVARLLAAPATPST
ncbi:MAG: lysophospholipid acyltransferase family protein [Gemmatimonadales bacterium]